PRTKKLIRSSLSRLGTAETALVRGDTATATSQLETDVSNWGTKLQITLLWLPCAVRHQKEIENLTHRYTLSLGHKSVAVRFRTGEHTPPTWNQGVRG